MKAFLGRVEDLAKSKEPGASKVLAKLRERGLTAKPIKSVRMLLDEAEGGESAEPKAKVSAEELAQARAAQLEALVS